MNGVFYFTDTHGRKDLFDAMRAWCYEQDPKCTIIFGGDAADRGPDGYEIMKTLLNDPQVIYLKGNHEDMFVNAAKQINDYVDKNHKYNQAEAKEFVKGLCLENDDVYLLCINGGLSTLASYVTDGSPKYMIEKIDKLHITHVYKNIDFCHAGYYPTAFQDMHKAEQETDAVCPNSLARRGLLWDRKALSDKWSTGRLCVFGHTPVQYLRLPDYNVYPSDYRVFPMRWGNKLDMDTGMVFSNVGHVLDVNALSFQKFEIITE